MKMVLGGAEKPPDSLGVYIHALKALDNLQLLKMVPKLPRSKDGCTTESQSVI